ncbi:MAG: 2-alkenal reductase [Parcubacteria group bacterium Gr01-1014_3]|nr:MAG: 2-alkenal reductase [Parcubacteria group bacterium Gr01-1014_3]
MEKILSITLALIFCQACTPAEIQPLPDPLANLPVKTAQQIYDEADYFVMIEGSRYADGDFQSFKLSGFLLQYADTYYIVTAGHIKKPGQIISEPLRVTLKNETNRYYHAKILAIDNDYDVAILKIGSDAFDFRGNIGKFGNSDLVELDDPVISIGNPPGHDWHLSTGKVLSRNYRNYKNVAKHIQHSAWGGHGSSGGPLLNRYGQIIGMNISMKTASIDETSSNRINALPAKYIQRFLEKVLQNPH